MKVYLTEEIRNVALAGHSGSGKSSLAEAMLFERGVIDRMGRTEDGNLQSDFLPEETRRKISIAAAVLPIETDHVKVNLVDLPGFRDFVGEIKGGMRICGGVVVVVDALEGFQVGTEFALNYAREMDLPVTFFINKLDKERSSYDQAMASLGEHVDKRLIQMTLPIGAEANLSGVVDLIRMKTIIETNGKVSMGPIPEELQAQAAELHEAIVDQAASGDEALAEKFLSGEELTFEEVAKGLKESYIAGDYFPIYCGAATAGIGAQSLTDFMEIGFPHPHEAHGISMEDRQSGEPREIHYSDDGPTVVYIYKTLSDKFGDHNFFKVVSGVLTKDTHLRNLTTGKDERLGHLYVQRGKNHEEVPEMHAGDLGAVTKLQNTHTNETLRSDNKDEIVALPNYPQQTVHMALTAAKPQDEDKIGEAAKKFVQLDPTLKIERDHTLAQTILSGMGDMHLDVLLARIKNQSGLECVLQIPKTPYRETIEGSAEGSYRHKKQSGGRGQFGEVHHRVRPNEGGAGLDFHWKIVGGVIPSKYETAVRKGVEQALERGIVAGYPVVDIVVECFEGKYHDVDSSDMAFTIASSHCFSEVAKNAKPVIMEPIYRLHVTVPEEYLGDVMGDISGKRGRILGQEMNIGRAKIEAQVPLAEMYEYSKQLRSMTQGRGIFEMALDHYEKVPPHIQQELIKAHDAQHGGH